VLERFTVGTFEPYVGQSFWLVVDDGRRLEMELIEAAGVGDARPFSIVFRGPGQPRLEQRIYRFEHDRVGSFELFIVPIGMDERGVRYEAVFN
jgi:hypothetical protein